MRLFCISFALLLYGNLARARSISSANDVYVETQDFKGFAASAVDNFDGFHCSDANEYLVDASKGLRESPICKEGQLGAGDTRLDFFAIVKKADVEAGKTDKPYLCCVAKNMCPDMEMVTERDEQGKEWTTVNDCSHYKPCQDTKKNFCLQEAGNNPNSSQRLPTHRKIHPEAPASELIMQSWKGLPVCCLKQTWYASCAYPKSDYVGEEPSVDACEKNFGRCNTTDHTSLCGQKHRDHTASSCCKPHDTELCPFGIYPFGLKGSNGLVDWRADNYGQGTAEWTKACIEMTNNTELGGAETYIHDYKCCAKAKLNATKYYGDDYGKLLSDEYVSLSTTDC